MSNEFVPAGRATGVSTPVTGRAAEHAEVPHVADETVPTAHADTHEAQTEARAPHAARSSGAPLLLFEQVSKWYGTVLALNQVTLELTGGITGLVGANGAGKSTLLRMANGQLRPTLGRVSVRGVDTWNWRARRLVGYCPDADAFYEEMSGRRFVWTMARLCGYTRVESHRRTEGVLARVGMLERADRKLRGYSKGMRQRIKLAQALLHEPELLILDEPLSGIDPIGRQELLELFQSLAAQGKCLLISSHELEALEKLTNHVVIMARGRVAAVGTLQQIRDLLEDHPVSVRIDVENPRAVARLLIALPEVLAVDVAPNMADGSGALVVKADHPKRFFETFGRLAVEHAIDVRRLEPLDESAHAILGYLLGGSGKT
ncbi:putative ABC transporter ATP-binding protein YxlF [Gemmata obscuriglobus]|uniref:ABC transporter ATP-binding protein n=1 Tax=Gemmata obscuriglobus TaxID=114 RepID=A0A2Z3HCJ5_9BACT|nr:ABC transporter ATP-binding protein [Gemmata obscuriglobus]AWM38970.1 ABC transporter ATP-binding protein [Gemmata obscuriglobus]QEG28012.1 putative ABC transporter ATP-binding protein YxlF [Gemmata obscuriglobus]VTS05550.1 abc transporter : ABC transporter, ATP-binding protein NosF OS=Fimbriimonas ginsengisoli Gsoil 348 GN=OP10G_2311 PE=3 SV=1: ABC_tran [Gemmata obscuriglobus UQM 2246]